MIMSLHQPWLEHPDIDEVGIKITAVSRSCCYIDSIRGIDITGRRGVSVRPNYRRVVIGEIGELARTNHAIIGIDQRCCEVDPITAGRLIGDAGDIP